jgi:nicotinate-nucleotide adenylyltransferase
MNVGLYFGTFNPIHVGHLIIANYMAQYTDLDQVWMVVTPQNPMKKNHNLLEDYHRLEMVRIAVDENDKLDYCDIEFKLPKPSYTSNTLVALEEKYPQHDFNLEKIICALFTSGKTTNRFWKITKSMFIPGL